MQLLLLARTKKPLKRSGCKVKISYIQLKPYYNATHSLAVEACLYGERFFLQGTKVELEDARERINTLSKQQEALQEGKAAYKAELAKMQEENELISGEVCQKSNMDCMHHMHHSE